MAKVKNSIRLDDTGKLARVGCTAGALSDPDFHGARNRIGPAQSADAIRSSTKIRVLHSPSCGTCVGSASPPKAITDFDNFLSSHEI
ncbi:hypothetical protein BDN72DRAFT_901356 [Pluteus cervinus]|uniref:Uncharacterized protein n=1 Tax=Pluteus cervinus TaxID=181527 RepID=A0ACD3AG11_9AGAR|nr:hypothetical protein BDN72DRAFT_901356 [Pluteus cervinus]